MTAIEAAQRRRGGSDQGINQALTRSSAAEKERKGIHQALKVDQGINQDLTWSTAAKNERKEVHQDLKAKGESRTQGKVAVEEVSDHEYSHEYSMRAGRGSPTP